MAASPLPAPLRPASTPAALAPRRRHLLATLRLALPVIIARAGSVTLLTVATLFTSHAGATELSYLSLALAPQTVLLMVAVGTGGCLSVLTAQAAGAGDQARVRLIFRAGLGFGLALGLVLALVCLGIGRGLALIGQQPDLAAGAGRVARALAPGQVPLLLYMAISLFLEGLGRPRPAMIAMVIGNGVNILLGWLLIPRLGAIGAGYAFSAAYAAMVLSLAVYLLALMKDRRALRLLRRGGPPGALRPVIATIARVGLPLGLAQGVESSAFSAYALMAGYLGAEALAGYNITMNVLTLVFMIATGLSGATAVRVGQAVGRLDGANMRRAGWTGVMLVLPPALSVSLFLIFKPQPVVGLYTHDPILALAATAAMAPAALSMVFDAVQGVTMGALRGLGDIWGPTLIQGLSFWVLSVPAGALLTFHFGFGLPGLFTGILCGTTAAAILLVWRFRQVGRRGVRRL